MAFTAFSARFLSYLSGPLRFLSNSNAEIYKEGYKTVNTSVNQKEVEHKEKCSRLLLLTEAKEYLFYLSHVLSR